MIAPLASTSGIQPLAVSQINVSDRYYLYDDFTTARAAGAVNGTLAEPVGGARNVTDTGSKMSIVGGALLSEQNGAGSTTNPILSYSGQTRVHGLTMLGRMTAVSGRARAYWAVASKSANSEGLLTPIPSSLYMVVSSSVAIIGAATTGVSYQFAYTLRASGVFLFIKGGAEYINWTLAWTSLLGTTPTLYPTINAFLGSQSEEKIRVSKRLYILTPLHSDGMSAATTDGLGNPEANSVTGTSYVDVGTWGVAGGKRSCSVLSSGLGFSYLPCSSSNVIIDAVCTRTAGVTGLVARYVDASNYLIAYLDGTNCKLDKVVAGITTNLTSGAVTYGATKVLSLHLDGTSARLFYGDAAVGTVATTPAAGSLNHGVYTTNIGATFDNLVIWPKGNEGQHEDLNLL